MAIEPDHVKGVVHSPFLVGLLGAVVALKGAPGDTWPERVFNVVCGALLAGFVSPAVAEYFGLSTPAMHSASAFVVGLFGLNMVAAVVQWIRSATLEDILPWKRR